MADTIKLPALSPGLFAPSIDQFIRARDIEVARAVLEAAAVESGNWSTPYWIAKAIRALKIESEA